jgi:hypothetical protein
MHCREARSDRVVGFIVCRSRPILLIFQDLQRDSTKSLGQEACKQPKRGVRFAACEYGIRSLSVHFHLAASCVSSSPRHGLLSAYLWIERPTESSIMSRLHLRRRCAFADVCLLLSDASRMKHIPRAVCFVSAQSDFLVARVAGYLARRLRIAVCIFMIPHA